MMPPLRTWALALLLVGYGFGLMYLACYLAVWTIP